MTQDARQRFAELLERHRGIVVKVAGAYAWQAEDRADLMQEIAAQSWRSFPRYDGERSFSTWMYRIALNVAISFVRDSSERSRRNVPLGPQAHDVADDNAGDHEREQHVRLLYRFIHKQKPLDRALLLLYLEDRNQREIAEILGLSETNVATKIGRLKQRLREEL
ncbi:MAG: sigma-70 family RNA polymerase sigma factor [Pseudoxanthomonas sp.]